MSMDSEFWNQVPQRVISLLMQLKRRSVSSLIMERSPDGGTVKLGSDADLSVLKN